MLQIPMSQKAIASAIGVNKSTISRELKRNCDNRSGKYVMDLAQRKADKRQQSKRRRQDFCEPQRTCKGIDRGRLQPSTSCRKV